MLFDDSVDEYLRKLREKGDTRDVLTLMNKFTEWLTNLENRSHTIFDVKHKQLLEIAFIAGWNAKEKEIENGHDH